MGITKHFSEQRKGGPLFDEYFAKEIRGQGGGRAFADVFYLETDEDWDALDEEFKIFVNTDLRRMRLKK